jgi:hypothetical protein
MNMQFLQGLPKGQATHLSDGAYAGLDEENESVVLVAPRLEGDHSVVLDRTGLERLLDFLKQTKVIKSWT